MSLNRAIVQRDMSLWGGLRDHRRMIVALQTQSVQRLEQVSAFVYGSEAVD